MKTKLISHSPILIAAALIPLWIAAYVSIEQLSEYATTLIFGAGDRSHLASAVQFLVYEIPKVLLLLAIVVFFVGIVRTYFSPERTKKALEGKPLFAGNVMAGTLGIVTPFCSCSAIPLFLGFIEAGIPLGVTLSFLIAAPMINEVAVILLLSLFGWQTALVYVAAGLSIAIFSGWIIGKLKLERWVEDWVYNVKVNAVQIEEERLDLNGRVRAGFTVVGDIVSKIWIYIVVGIAVGAGVHGYVPEDFMASFMGKDAWYSVPLSVLIGIPLYSNAAGIIPIVQALLEKGASLGTALAFMMSVIGLSLPETIILRKVLKLPLIITFVGIVGSGIILVGFLFNLLY